MLISEKGVRFIKQWEKLELSPYECAAGHKTIGFGHRVLYGEQYDAITEQQAEMILITDLANAQRAVHKVRVPLEQHEYDALVSFTFNVGVGNFEKSTLLKKLNQGDRAGAMTELLKWHHVNGTDSKGLMRRREQEREMFKDGVYAESH